MLERTKSFFKLGEAKLGATLVVGGEAAYQIGAHLDVHPSQYMNTNPEMAMVFGVIAVLFGLAALFSAACDYNDIPCGALGLDMMDSHF